MKRLAILGLLLLLMCGFTVGTPMLNFEGAARWINSPGLDAGGLQGKVVLVDFWEYTCLNCLRTLPYLREWYKRYHNDGFVIVGVHTPEFAFSSRADQVEAAAKRLDVTWPIAVDSSLAIWKRYGVNEWPTELLYDQSGKLVEMQLGEGNYPYTESKIQGLLKAANPSLSLPPLMALLPQDNYDKPGRGVLSAHAESSRRAHADRRPAASFFDPSTDVAYHDGSSEHRDGAVYLDGFWHATHEAVAFGGGSGYFDMAYHAIEVEVVMTPGTGDARVDVTQNGKPLAKDDAGSDVRYDCERHVVRNVDASRAYHVVENKKYGNYDLRLSPKGYGLAIYDVDFESCEVPGTH